MTVIAQLFSSPYISTANSTDLSTSVAAILVVYQNALAAFPLGTPLAAFNYTSELLSLSGVSVAISVSKVVIPEFRDYNGTTNLTLEFWAPNGTQGPSVTVWNLDKCLWLAWTVSRQIEIHLNKLVTFNFNVKMLGYWIQYWNNLYYTYYESNDLFWSGHTSTGSPAKVSWKHTMCSLKFVVCRSGSNTVLFTNRNSDFIVSCGTDREEQTFVWLTFHCCVSMVTRAVCVCICIHKWEAKWETETKIVWKREMISCCWILLIQIVQTV